MTLADLRTALEILPAGTSLLLSRDELLTAIAATSPTSASAASPDPSDEMLTVEDAAKRIGVSKRWCYDHAKEIGGKKLSRRCVRFSSRAVERYLARRG